MDDKYRQLIESMAAKLGVTAEHLWGVLVAQAPISGAVDLVLCVVMVAAVVWWAWLVKRKTTRQKTAEAGVHKRAEWEDEAVLFWATAVLAGVLVLIFIIESAHETVAAFFNPEYWALLQLLKC